MKKKTSTIKDLKVRDDRAVKGGNLLKACATGQHIPEATITV